MERDSSTWNSRFFRATDAGGAGRRGRANWREAGEESAVLGLAGMVGDLRSAACLVGLRHCARADAPPAGGPTELLPYQAGQGTTKGETAQGGKVQAFPSPVGPYPGERRGLRQSASADAAGVLAEPDHRPRRTLRSSSWRDGSLSRIPLAGRRRDRDRPAELEAIEGLLRYGEEQVRP